LTYFNRNRLHIEAIATDSQAHHAGLAVQGFRLVEDEVANAIVDGMPAVILDGLEGMGVVTHEHVSSSEDKHVGIMTLTGYGLQFVFLSPV
jgi:hypothetical protein